MTSELERAQMRHQHDLEAPDSILQLTEQGLSAQAISQRLGVTKRTVERTRERHRNATAEVSA